jgi:hypothetical protein
MESPGAPAGQLAHAAGGVGAGLVRGEARPRRIAGYAPTAPLLGVPGGPSRPGSGGTLNQPGWVAKTSSGAGLGCVWTGWWSAHGEPLVAKSPELGFIPTQPPSKGGALAPFVVSVNFAHLRDWEMDWGNVRLDLCGGLVRESRATWLAGARRGPSPGLYR